MLKFIDGFDNYGPDGTQFALINSNFDTGWILGGGGSITFGPGFTSDSKAVYLSRSSVSFSYIERRFETVADVVVIGFQMRANRRFDGLLTIPGVLSLDWPSVMEIEGNQGTAIPILNTGYHVELKIHRASKFYEMRLNGYPYIDGTLLTPDPIPNLLPIRFGFTGTGQSAQMVLSNVHLIDSEPGKYTDFIGPQIITSSRPTESVEPVTWEPVPGSKTNVEIMNNIPPQIVQYTQSDQVGASDYYRSSSPVIGTVTAVAVTSVLAKTDIDDQRIKIGIGEVGDRKEGPEIEVEIQPQYLQQVFETDDQNNDWTDVTATGVAFGATIQPRP